MNVRPGRVALAFAALAACGEEPGIETLSGRVDTAVADTAVVEDTRVTSDTAASEDTAVAVDTVEEADTAAVEDTVVEDTAPDAEDATDTVDPCALVDCAAPPCPLELQVIPEGQCCPICTTPTCESPEDCTRCTWPTAPASAADCYCTICPTALMTNTECQANQAAWELHCADWEPDPACPIPRCINEPPPVCDAGECVEDPQACRTDSDCVRCNHGAPPASPDECQCPGCGVPTTATWCEEIELAVLEQCEGLLDDCLPPPCPVPPPLACNQETFRCVQDFPVERPRREDR